MPTGSRKTHTKSRNGCGQCKKRRIKCDGRAPLCHNCEKRNLKCDYAELGLSVSSGENTNRSPTTSISPTGLEVAQVKKSPTNGAKKLQPISFDPLKQLYLVECGSDLKTQEQELLHHWMTGTPVHAGGKRNAQLHRLWHTTVPELAQGNEFLTNSMLALSSAHLAAMVPAKAEMYADEARKHHVLSMKQFRTSSAGGVPELNGATVAFSKLCVLSALSLYSNAEVNSNDEFLDNFMQWILLMRHTTRFLSSTKQNLSNDEKGLAAFLAYGKSIPTNQGIMDSLSALEKHNLSSDDSDDIKAVYNMAISRTQNWYHLVTPAVNWAHEARWTMIMPDKYFELLVEKQPIALVILAHWCAKWHHTQDRWFLNNWPERVVNSIEEKLGSDWKWSLTWVYSELSRPRLL